MFLTNLDRGVIISKPPLIVNGEEVGVRNGRRGVNIWFRSPRRVGTCEVIDAAGDDEDFGDAGIVISGCASSVEDAVAVDVALTLFDVFELNKTNEKQQHTFLVFFVIFFCLNLSVFDVINNKKVWLYYLIDFFEI